MKIRPVGAELFHADGQTENDKSLFAICELTSKRTWTVAALIDKRFLYVINTGIVFGSLLQQNGAGLLRNKA
jgi:hypothetical protein